MDYQVKRLELKLTFLLSLGFYGTSKSQTSAAPATIVNDNGSFQGRVNNVWVRPFANGMRCVMRTVVIDVIESSILLGGCSVASLVGSMVHVL